MKIGALAPWFGAKRTLAPRIIEELGPHSAYWEPFCGSCSVLFAKPRATYESVNDLHNDLFNLAKVVQDPRLAEDLYGRVRRTLFHEDMLPNAKAILSGEWRTARGDDPDADVGRAYWYMVFSWMGLNGVAGTPLHHTGTFACRYSSKGGNGATRWKSVCDSIPDWHERLIGVQILSRDAFLILEELDDAERTMIYCDPPYITKGSNYVHEFKREDHQRLADLLRRFKRARVIVSYYDHPDLPLLYPLWTCKDVAVTKSMVNGGMRVHDGPKVAPEVLLINGPSLAQAQQSLF